MGFSITSSGDFNKTIRTLTRLSTIDFRALLDSCGQMGVNALRAATPIDTGLAGSSWSFKTTSTGSGCIIDWYNGDVESGFNVVISLQYGYHTGTGGYVAGRDFINPAMKPVFDKISDRIWAEVRRA